MGKNFETRVEEFHEEQEALARIRERNSQIPIYKPTQEDIDWARNMMAILKDGGVMNYPATHMIYQIDHQKKTITLQNPEQLLSFPSFVIHYQTIDVFREISYAVIPAKGDISGSHEKEIKY